MKKLLLLMLISIGAHAQTTIFNCGTGGTAFATSGSCSVQVGSGKAFAGVNQTSLSGSLVNIIPQSTDHNVGSFIYQTLENVQAFKTVFTFQPDGQNISFFLQNTNNNPGYEGNLFAGGAGGEAGFYQGIGSTAPPNNIWALLFDSYGGNSAGSNTFTYSSVQVYQSAQSPANGNVGGPYFGTNKISTSPVPLNSPSSSVNTCVQTVGGTCDTYQAEIDYDGSTVNVCLADVTLGNACTSGSGGTGTFFTQSFTNQFIPSIVGGTTAWVGMTGAAGTIVNPYPLNLLSWKYVTVTPTGTPTTVAYNAAATTNNGTQSVVSPTFSVAPGTYPSTQSVTISEASPSSYVCYELSCSGTPTYYPQPSNNTTSSNPGPACNEGTQYSTPVTISSSCTLYAAGGTTWGGNGGTPVAGLPSPLVAATYTIGGTPTASAPTFSPTAGTYTGAQSVTASTSTSGCGPYIYFDTNPTPVTNQTNLTVSLSETVYAYVHGCPGYLDSSIPSAAFTIKATTPTFSPPAGSYSGTQNVTLSTVLGGVICWNTTGSPATNGTTGCSVGTKYTGAITVPASETIYAVAGGPSLVDSTVGSAAYVINPAGSPLILIGKASMTGVIGAK